MKILSFIAIAIVGLSLSISSCKKDETDTDSPSGPSNEHGSNDGIKDNGDGSYTVTLGNETFITKARDFSKESVITAPKTVSASKESEYALSVSIEGFGIQDNSIIAGHDSKLLIYDMASNKQTDDYSVGNTITGIDVNGAIMTSEGSELVNFYNIKDGKVSKHFFTLSNINGSKFLSVCYLDYNKAYFYDESEVVYFQLDNATQSTKAKIVDIPSFARLRYSVDEKSIYFCMGQLSKPDPNDPNAAYIDYSAIRVYDRSSKQFTDYNSADHEQYTGIAVDANYIYIALEDMNTIRVINKHNQADAGSFTIDSPSFLQKMGESLYAYSSNSQKVIKYHISFN
jgi:hypothetical protein